MSTGPRQDPMLSTLVAAIELAADLFDRPREFVSALRRLGVDVDPAIAVPQLPAAAEMATLVERAQPHITAFADGVTFEELLAALELVVPIADVVDAALSASFELPGATVDWADVASDLTARFPQMLVFDVIDHRAGWLVALLELCGLVVRSRYEFEDGERAGPMFQSVAVDLHGFRRLLDDPGQHFGALFLPGGTIDTDRIGTLLKTALGSLVHVRRIPADDDYIVSFLGSYRGPEPVTITSLKLTGPSVPPALSGVEILVGPHRPGNDPAVPAHAAAIAVRATELDPAPIPAGPGTLTIDVPTPSLGLAITPAGSLSLIAALAGDVSVSFAVAPNVPWRLFGGDDGPRAELGGVTATGTFSPDDGDLSLSLDLRQLSLRLDSEGSDSFLAGIVSGVAAELDAGLTISRLGGLRLNADTSLQMRLSVERTIGPITIKAVTLGLGLQGDEFSVSFRVDTEATIGPLQVSVADVGVALHLLPGGPGGLSVRAGLDPPDRVAFSFTASDAISGGGFLDIDHDAGRYSGGAALKVLSIGVSALAVIDTRLPAGEEGWAFFASLGIDIPGIPIGFGFTLEGLGGLIALNRRIDADALALGLRQGAVDAIMFPDDPVRDAAVLIPQIDAYFPIEVGNTVIGPVIEIGWGSPLQLLSAQIGVAISLPQGLIVIMGSVAVVLPHPNAPLIEIHLDSLGVIDLAAGTISVTASLYDSRLLGIIELSGDMAFFLATRPTPYFALSIGGWHPAFQPPDRLPSVFGQLRRIRAEIALTGSISVSFESYLALTPNTVQFGGAFELVASVKVALATYTARGWFTFDVLLRFTPFKLLADVSAGIAVYSGDKELMGVSLGVRVEGPQPWYASGYAQFRFFGIKVKFDFSVGSKAPAALAPITDVLPLMREQLAADDAWEVERPTGIVAGLVLAPASDATAAMVAAMAPDSRLIVRQTVAPLERTLECYGTDRIAQSMVTAEVTVRHASTGVPIAGIESDQVVDWFAPAQFEHLNDAQRLSAPSYEPMVSGVAVGAAGITLGAPVTVEEGHETLVWQPPVTAGKPTKSRRLGVVRGERHADGWFDLGATAARTTRGPTAMAPKIRVSPVTSARKAGVPALVVTSPVPVSRPRRRTR